MKPMSMTTMSCHINGIKHWTSHWGHIVKSRVNKVKCLCYCVFCQALGCDQQSSDCAFGFICSVETTTENGDFYNYIALTHSLVVLTTPQHMGRGLRPGLHFVNWWSPWPCQPGECLFWFLSACISLFRFWISHSIFTALSLYKWADIAVYRLLCLFEG